jgi:hypothetical protein
LGLVEISVYLLIVGSPLPALIMSELAAVSSFDKGQELKMERLPPRAAKIYSSLNLEKKPSSLKPMQKHRNLSQSTLLRENKLLPRTPVTGRNGW